MKVVHWFGKVTNFFPLVGDGFVHLNTGCVSWNATTPHSQESVLSMATGVDQWFGTFGSVFHTSRLTPATYEGGHMCV